jgi:hypothetical protein
MKKKDMDKKYMVENFSNSTGLTLDFSLQCLSEMQWDVEKAQAVFLNAKVFSLKKTSFQMR